MVQFKRGEYMSKKSIIVLLIFMIFCLLFIGCKNENTGKDENDENIEITIKFNSNGGSETKDIKVEKNSLIDEPEDPMREGYGFMGWYYKGENWNFSEDKVTKSIELTAKWVNLENYKIDGNKILSFARYDIIEIPNSYTKNGELIDITEINGFFGNNVIIYKIDINNKYYKVSK